MPGVAVWAVWLALLAVVALWGRALVEGGTNLKLGLPPFHAIVEVRVGPGTLVALAVAGLLVAVLPVAADRLGWRTLLAVGFVATVGWIVVLNGIEGTDGLVRGLESRDHEYPADVPAVDDLGPREFLRTFTARIDDYTTHVRGHPPGFLLLLWALAAVGFEGLWPAVVVCIVGGALAAPAVLAAVRAVAGEGLARRAMPFAVVAPAALWVGSSADGLYAGLGAVAVSLVVCAAAREPSRAADALAIAGGVALGGALLGSYGLVLLGLVPLPVLVRRRAWRPAALWAAGGAAVLGVFALAGFWWVDGLLTTRSEYHDGIASLRPFAYFAVANLATFATALGPATLTGLARLRDAALWSVVGGGLLAAAAANLSGMSKGEVERIWLPFAVWVLPAAAVLDRRRWWLAGQLGIAIAIQTWLITGW